MITSQNSIRVLECVGKYTVAEDLDIKFCLEDLEYSVALQMLVVSTC